MQEMGSKDSSKLITFKVRNNEENFRLPYFIH